MPITSSTARKPAKKTAAKKTAAKKTAAPQRTPTTPADAVDLGARDVVPVDKFPIFRINGVQYYADTVPRMNVQLKYLRLARTQGANTANGYLIEALVGPEGYAALENYDALTNTDMTRIMTALLEAVQGAIPAAPKGELSIG